MHHLYRQLRELEQLRAKTTKNSRRHDYFSGEISKLKKKITSARSAAKHGDGLAPDFLAGSEEHLSDGLSGDAESATDLSAVQTVLFI